jgi:hypothetical protein
MVARGRGSLQIEISGLRARTPRPRPPSGAYAPAFTFNAAGRPRQRSVHAFTFLNAE